MWRSCSVAIGLAVALVVCPATNGQEPKQAFVRHVQYEISLDGVLDEPDWAETPPIGQIIQREPNQGEPASERTEVRLLYDSKNFYIGVECYDSASRSIVATQLARDGDLSADDKIEILIDTFRDRRNAFYFATNPAGALIDGLIIENGQLNMDWDAIWDVRVHRSDNGWSAEFAIPFKSLTFKTGPQTWGFNFSRQIKRKLEEDRWASPRLDISFFQVSEAGEISGFAELERGSGIDVRPFISGHATHEAIDERNVLTGKGGLDAFFKLTPNLKLSATANTDFAETEVDARQINLTRFPLFFPEKRAFFLENTGIFSFSNISDDIIPFFSRRIGLTDNGIVPILYGVKLTGKAGAYDVGVLDVRTRSLGAIGAKDFLVTRVKRTILNQSYIGGILTSGNPTDPTGAHTYGGDLRLATSNFAGKNKPVYFDAYMLKSDNNGTINSRAHNNNSYGVGLNAPSDILPITVSWKRIDNNFNPTLGFVPRTNVRKLDIETTFSPRPRKYLNVRQMFHEFSFTRFTRLDDGKVESWRVFMAPVNYRMNTGDRYEFNYVPTFERLVAPFEISPGVVVPTGSYRFTRYRTEFQSAQKRAWYVSATWWFGTYWSGRASEVDTSFQYKLAPHMQASLSFNQTFARLKEGSFVSRVISLRANYSPSPFVTFFNFIQYDNDSRSVGWQSRVRWIAKPGNEIFLVFNQGWIQEEQGGFHFHPGDRSIASKIEYTFRF